MAIFVIMVIVFVVAEPMKMMTMFAQVIAPLPSPSSSSSSSCCNATTLDDKRAIPTGSNPLHNK